MRDLIYILNAAGEPEPCPDVGTWTYWMAAADRRVALTRFGDVSVSTVFIGTDMSVDWSGRGQPILWETMVRGGPLDRKVRRYATRAEAEVGHTAMCMAVTQALEADGEGATR